MADVNSFIKRLTDQLTEWDTQITSLKEKAKLSTGEMKTKIDVSIAEIEKKKNEINTQLDHVKQNGEEAWKTLKDGLDKAASDMKKTFSDVFSKFKM
jgi:phage-related minor tail protein